MPTEKTAKKSPLSKKTHPAHLNQYTFVVLNNSEKKLCYG